MSDQAQQGDNSPTTQTSGSRFRASLLVGGITVAVVGAVVWYLEFGRLTQPADVALPGCDAELTHSMARRILLENPKAQELQITDFVSPVEKSYDAKAERRTCSGIILHGGGQERADYTVQWHDKKQQLIWVEFE